MTVYELSLARLTLPRRHIRREAVRVDSDNACVSLVDKEHTWKRGSRVDDTQTYSGGNNRQGDVASNEHHTSDTFDPPGFNT